MSFYENQSHREQLTEQPMSPPAWRELGVLVLDGSGSMTLDLQTADSSAEFLPRMTKGAAVDVAVRDLLARLKVSQKKANFSIASVSFNDVVTDRRDPEAVVDMGLFALNWGAADS